MKTSVIIASIVISIACAIESQSAKSTRQIPKLKVEKRPCKGKKCSISMDAPRVRRIVGGDEAIPHSWPWMVFIFCAQFDDQNQHGTCGGTLISDRWIITAAHCLHINLIKLNVPRDCKVYLGKHDISVKESTFLMPPISDCFTLASFNVSDVENGYDLALIKLATPVDYTSAIKPISLPFGRPELPYNKSCIATGWGWTKHGDNKLSDKLMQLSLALTDVAFCRDKGVFRSTNRIICTTTWDRSKGVCGGDSGGPLACQDADEKWYLRGVSSFVQAECMATGYFTRVVFFEEWIKSIISRN